MVCDLAGLDPNYVHEQFIKTIRSRKVHQLYSKTSNHYIPPNGFVDAAGGDIHNINNAVSQASL